MEQFIRMLQDVANYGFDLKLVLISREDFYRHTNLGTYSVSKQILFFKILYTSLYHEGGSINT